jgi:hypothetical protein
MSCYRLSCTDFLVFCTWVACTAFKLGLSDLHAHITQMNYQRVHIVTLCQEAICLDSRDPFRFVLDANHAVCYYAPINTVCLVFIAFVLVLLVRTLVHGNLLNGPDEPMWRNGIRACLKNKSRKG